MDDKTAALVKKIGEGNKSLSVIVAEDKLAKFKLLSQGLSLSMGWLLNQAIDRYLASGSIDIFKTTIGNDNAPKIADAEASAVSIEDLIKSSIETANQPITQAIEDLRSELSEISDKLQNSQKNINKKLVDK